MIEKKLPVRYYEIPDQRVSETVLHILKSLDNGRTNLYQFNWVKTANPSDNCPPKNVNACIGFTSPEANGLVFVLSVINVKLGSNQSTVETSESKSARRCVPTFLSISLSHRSLMTHPAPLMTIAPVPNNAIFQAQIEGGTRAE